MSTWKETIDGASEIEFDLIQGSDLLEKLALPKHRGRAWFWWSQPTLDLEWLKDRYEEQADAAGEKYRPDLQVDLPIEQDLRALGFDQSLIVEFEQHRQRASRSIRELRFGSTRRRKLSSRYKAIQASSAVLLQLLEKSRLTADAPAATLRPIGDASRACSSAISAAADLEFQLERDWEKLPEETPNRDQLKPPDETRHYPVRRLQDNLAELESWFESSAGRTLQDGFYFLSGAAGSGKTHLFLEAIKQALEAKRPGVVLFGSRFGRGDLWASICDQLGLPPLGADTLLGAMNAAAEAAAPPGRRFAILIDAMNETVPPDFWHTHLPTLRAAISRWPHVTLAVSCRDTYLDIIDDGSERAHYVRCSHPGFVGRETEAAQKYFNHFGLEAPRIPLLTPEFTIPLFLRLYCESLRDSGLTAPAEGHEGRIRIFDRYLTTKIQRVSRRFRPTASTTLELDQGRHLVSGVVEGLLDELTTSGQEGMPIRRAVQIAQHVTNGSEEEAGIVLGALQSEGVLTHELLYLDDRTQEGIRIAFQAFADFLLLKRRLTQVSEPLADDDDFRAWLSEECSWGILEAAAVMLPETHSIECPISFA